MIKMANTKKIAILFFIFSLGCVLTFIILDIFFYQQGVKKTLFKNALIESKEKEKSFIKYSNKLEDILLSINSSKLFFSYLNKPQENQANLIELFLSIAKQEKNIMQLRFIDKDGFEKIKIDRPKLNFEPKVLRKTKLQNKSERYYFADSKNRIEKIWYSNLDLNIEFGKVQIPYKPTLRAMLPIIERGVFKGVLVLNYHMQEIIEKISKSVFFNVIISNSKNEIINHYDSSKNWSAYTNIDYKLSDEIPEVSAPKEAYLVNTSQNYIIKKIDFNLPNKLYIILKANEEYFSDILKAKFYHYLIVTLLIVILSILMSFLFTNYLKKIFLIIKDTKELNSTLNETVQIKTKELSKSKQKIKDIVTTINDFIWEVDQNGIYTYVSPQIENILGFKPNEVIGKTVFDFMSEIEAEKIKNIFETNMKFAKPIIQLTNENIHKNGSIIYLETSANPIYDENDILVGYRGSDRDITQKVNAQKIITNNMQKIEELNRKLEQKINTEIEKNREKDSQLFAQSKMAAMGDMISNIAHQWRQPLSAISSIASGIRLKVEFEQLKIEDIPQEMDDIVDKTQYLSNTIDTFMNFLKENRDFKTANIKDILKHSIQLVKSAMDNHFIELTHNLNEIENLDIHTIPSEVEQVILNILNNSKDAIKESHEKNGKISMLLSYSQDSIHIKIEDNGGGIPKEVLPRIFEPYFTTKHKSMGTGLGLHMSYRVIKESLEGEIYAQNGENGAIFNIDLPIKIEAK